MMLTLRHLLLGWLVLVALSLNVLAWDLERRTPAPGGIKLAWALAVLVFGPLGLLGYVVSYRTPLHALESQTAGAAWGRALGPAMISVAGYITVAALGLGILVRFLPDAGPVGALAATYLAPFAFGWLALRAPLLAWQAGLPYGVAILRAALAEFISATLAFAGIYPTLAFLQSHWFDGGFDLVDPRFWIMLPLAGLAGVTVAYPFHVWLARRGMDAGLAGSTRADAKAATPSLRQAWGALVLSLAVAVVSVGLTVMGLSAG